ncbi:MAG: radical SAM protein [Deltaproteobacteria bacterium]|nr:radical SAM protein [Deltaproteobacteria bacterium]
MTNPNDLLDMLARINMLGHSVGLSDDELSMAVQRLASASASMTLDETSVSETHQRLMAGVKKNLDDDPMLIGWALKLAARLSELSWKKFFDNFILRLVVERRSVIDRLTRELGHAPPVTIVVSPTMACNLRCRGCYAQQYPRGASMSPDLLRKVLRESRELGVRFITVTGGEPFTYDGLLDMAEEFSDLTFMTYTNGTLIDEATADRLAALGNVLPAFSIEGYEQETTERRGLGVYRAVLDAMARLKRRGTLFGVSVTPTRFNTDLLSSDAFIDFLMDKGASFAWLFTYIPVGLEPDVGMMATPEQRDQLRRARVRWRKTRPIFLGDFWNDGACVGGCLSASRYAFVTPEGDVQPCTFVHFTTHNLRDHSLREIFQSPFFKAIRGCQPYDRNLLRSCKIIDHPHVLRRLVEQHGARPTYPGAESIVSDPALCRHLDQYAREYGRLAERGWRGPDYQEGRRALVPFSGLVDLYERYPERMARAEQVTEANRASAPGSAGQRSEEARDHVTPLAE